MNLTVITRNFRRTGSNQGEIAKIKLDRGGPWIEVRLLDEERQALWAAYGLINEIERRYSGLDDDELEQVDLVDRSVLS